MMTGQLPPSQWSMDSPAARYRDWNVSRVVQAFFGEQAVVDMEQTGEESFKRQIYRSLIAQVLFLKTEIEGWRAQNVW